MTERTALKSLPVLALPAETLQHLFDEHEGEEPIPAEHAVAVHLYAHGGGGRPDLADAGVAHTHHGPATAAAPAPTGTNGLAVAALVLGIIGVAAGMIPLFFIVSGICGLLATIFGCVGRGKARAGAPYKTMATWGVLTGLLAIGLSAYGMTVVVGAVDQFGRDMDNISNDFESRKDCLANVDVADWSLYCD